MLAVVRCMSKQVNCRRGLYNMIVVNLQRMIGGTSERPDVALEMISSNSSNTVSEIGACMSISTGRPCSNAHLRLSAPWGVDLVKTVDSDVATGNAESCAGSVCSLSSRLKGNTTEMSRLSLGLDSSLRCKIQRMLTMVQQRRGYADTRLDVTSWMSPSDKHRTTPPSRPPKAWPISVFHCARLRCPFKAMTCASMTVVGWIILGLGSAGKVSSVPVFGGLKADNGSWGRGLRPLRDFPSPPEGGFDGMVELMEMWLGCVLGR